MQMSLERKAAPDTLQAADGCEAGLHQTPGALVEKEEEECFGEDCENGEEREQRCPPPQVIGRVLGSLLKSKSIRLSDPRTS